MSDGIEFTYLNYYYDDHDVKRAIPLIFKLNSEWWQKVDLEYTPFYLNKTDSVL